jgi:hypothetical protein
MPTLLRLLSVVLLGAPLASAAPPPSFSFKAPPLTALALSEVPFPIRETKSPCFRLAAEDFASRATPFRANPFSAARASTHPTEPTPTKRHPLRIPRVVPMLTLTPRADMDFKLRVIEPDLTLDPEMVVEVPLPSVPSSPAARR